MIDRLITFSAQNRLLVIILVGLAAIAGWWSMHRLPLDAIPDLSDTQVIIYSRWDRSPDLVEDQVTYPIITAMLGAPGVRTVRGISDFGYSYVYVIFDEGTDLYRARSRTLEYLATVLPRLPQGVKTELGPDATGLGWIYQYALVDTTGRQSLADLRSLQDWHLRYHLKSVRGVAEVAAVGGYTRQYEVSLDPVKLQAYGIPVKNVVDAVQGGNNETGGRLIEFGGTEYMVRGRGYARSLQDFEEIVLVTDGVGTPIRIRDVGTVGYGPDLRRGCTDLDGKGEAVSGIVVMRQWQNALEVIDRVKAKIAAISPGLPEGVKVVPVYDRSELIRRAIDNLKMTIAEVILTVVVVIFVFLRHPPSALIPAVTIPLAILISFIPFSAAGVTANIMSLAGIAIAIGAMVDASIIIVEQTHNKLELWERAGRPDHADDVILSACREVGGASFFALLVIAVSFLPIFALEAQEGRLFKPLAWTKTLSMLVAALLAVTLDPALRLLFMRLKAFSFRPAWLCRLVNGIAVGTILDEREHPLSRFLMKLYEPAVRWALAHRKTVIGSAFLLIAVTVPVAQRLGREFMPPLDEGTLLYMPSTMPGISIAEAQKVLHVTDRIIGRFPEVAQVLGKAGRAETATDPAPLSMLETVIVLKPREAWREVPRWYSSWAPDPLKKVLRRIWSDRLSTEELVAQLNEAVRVTGLSNAWTMPVKGRIDMLTTGIRTPVGLKIAGGDVGTIERVGAQIEGALRGVKGTRSVFAERTGGGYFLDFNWNRPQLARYGLSVEDVQPLVANAIGGDTVTTTVEGRERYGVNIRYQRDYRSDLPMLRRLPVQIGEKGQVPLSELCDVTVASGPSMLRNEDGLLTGYVYVDIDGRDIAAYIGEADRLLRQRITLPAGYSWSWSGQYEAMERVKERLGVVIPATLLLIVGLLYLNTGSAVKTGIVLLAVPFSAIGAMWLLWALNYSMSVGVWVGIIALLGVDAETGVFMLLYLDLAYEEARKRGELTSMDDLREAVVHGAARRLRPKVMTVATMFLGLLPIMWSGGTGADVMKRIAAPMLGGIFTSFLLELIVYPVLYEMWKERETRKEVRTT